MSQSGYGVARAVGHQVASGLRKVSSDSAPGGALVAAWTRRSGLLEVFAGARVCDIFVGVLDRRWSYL
jgi:hypothetical protein